MYFNSPLHQNTICQKKILNPTTSEPIGNRIHNYRHYPTENPELRYLTKLDGVFSSIKKILAFSLRRKFHVLLLTQIWPHLTIHTLPLLKDNLLRYIITVLAAAVYQTGTGQVRLSILINSDSHVFDKQVDQKNCRVH